MTIREVFGELGFEFWNTGGSCTAFALRLTDAEDGPYILVTDGEDAVAPTEGTKTFTVGRYTDGNDDCHYSLPLGGALHRISDWCKAGWGDADIEAWCVIAATTSVEAS